VAVPVFIKLGLYRAVIRYLPERAMWTIVQATAAATLLWIVVVFLFLMTGYYGVPRSVPILYWALSTLLIGGSRFLAKRVLWPVNNKDSRGVVIYGAGRAGATVAEFLRKDGSYRIIAFLDDDPVLHGRDVAGIPVYSPKELARLIDLHKIKDLILSIPSASASQRQAIIESVSGHRIRIQTVPSIGDLVSGKYAISEIREIDIDELLGRSSIPPDPELLCRMIEGKTIMVTGAGGSIGSELCRLIVVSRPQRLILFEANEFALYQIERELLASNDIVIVPVLGSIVDAQRVRHAIGAYNVNVVFHAAAHKHVPMIEANALEGIRNNVMGTRNVVDIAFEAGVQDFVLISSDKAVRPTNVMGATKRWAELLVSDAAARARIARTDQHFATVRFGNVLGSNGSVVPLFKEQIARGGPITLTDPSMTRYFMSIHEAAELIVQAGALSQGGDVFLLDMGSPILIKSLAENMVRLAGLTIRDDDTPNGDIEIVVTGKRPGEKMYEELFYDDKSVKATTHAKILRATKDTHQPMGSSFDQLMLAVDQGNEAEARQILFSLIKE
jgi:FlaA1/EpsC-like NDP-sugar epimerase